MIAEKTGWTYEFILDGLPWFTLRMMLADAPGMKKGKKTKQLLPVKKVQGDELLKILGL